MNKVLPALPISVFIIFGFIFSNINAGSAAGFLTMVIPLFLSGVWTYWFYRLRPKFNITQE